MRPISFKQIWGPPDHTEFQGNCVREALDHGGITLDRVLSVSYEDLAQKLKSLTINVRGCRINLYETDLVDHARGLRELARRTHTVSVLLGDLEITRDVGRLRDTLDEIHGFGEALSAKSILFLVRCFGIGYQDLPPRELLPIANGLTGEYWVGKALETPTMGSECGGPL